MPAVSPQPSHSLPPHAPPSSSLQLATSAVACPCRERLPSSSTAAMPSQPQPASVHALPPELTEHVLILTARAGFPTAIAALAQTCRALTALVYHSPDHHLWREVFLATFDDPRRSPRWVPARERTWDWGAAFRARIWAANFFKPGPSPSASSTSLSSAGSDDDDEIERCTRALETLIDVAHTALPYPPSISFLPTPQPSFTAVNTIPGSAPQPGFPSYPIFPPSPTPDPLLAALPFGNCPCAQGYCEPARTDSSNVKWLEAVVAHGFPPYLARRLSGKKWEGGIMGEDLPPNEARMMQALARVVAFTGFLPARTQGSIRSGSSSGSTRGSDASTTGSDDESSGSEGSHDESADDDDEEKQQRPSSSTTPARLAAETFIAGASVVAGMSLDTSTAAQARRARRLARMRVYNLRFLSPWRAWGPFHLVEPTDMPRAPRTRPSPPPAPLKTNGKARARESDEEPACGPYDVDSDDEETDWEPLPEQLRPASHARPPPPSLPPPATLTPDWAFLAAVRVVVEANLREAVGAAELAGLTTLDGLRNGSAPIDLSGGGDTGRVRSVTAPAGPLEAFQGDSTRRRGKGVDDFGGPAPSTGLPATTEGWDWAGVTGIWRRCICWLDYRDLISHNLSSDFNDPDLTEAVRIVPMRLRVASYGPPPVPAFPDRPTLHIEGETAANGATGTVRRLQGTVSVVKDGSVHWRIVLLGLNEGEPTEWVTEGVQIGGQTSAMGVLGLWTGSQHERMDPLGPFWAWKVG
ncbi:uncharacterized protein C8Q71DRAFT_721069 [Rhodofomes roseus]|uniref:F-box domain-containing protein n=2 Tax=Rhodofomes roseus TaxID=34475 RepID=A0ABQ8KQA5_9APHY|nr:uncharacterized protein C8Q71DRAFT_721069 [Rhodofomes roseus]KAH9840524.1 hypothetical protein C8Q71DRAFT_721069 [Rhodofomes roseus]